MNITIINIDDAENLRIDEICESDLNNPYQNYPTGRKNKGTLFASEIRKEKREQDMHLWLAKVGGKEAGLIGLQYLAWDSEQFEMAMGKIWPIVILPNSTDIKKAVAKGLLFRSLALAREKGIRHLACRVVGDNYEMIHALEEEGFLLMDTLMTYIYQPGSMPSPNLQGKHHIRLYEESDFDRLLDIARNVEYQFRHARDPWLSQQKVKSMYEAWTANCCRHLIADEVLVAEVAGKIRGFLGYRRNRFFLEETGKELWGSGLGVVSPEATGAYVSLLKAAVTRQFSGRERSLQPGLPGLMDFETQLSNRSILRVWEAFGFRQVRFAYDYHKGDL